MPRISDGDRSLEYSMKPVEGSDDRSSGIFVIIIDRRSNNTPGKYLIISRFNDGGVSLPTQSSKEDLRIDSKLMM